MFLIYSVRTFYIGKDFWCQEKVKSSFHKMFTVCLRKPKKNKEGGGVDSGH